MHSTNLWTLTGRENGATACVAAVETAELVCPPANSSPSGHQLIIASTFSLILRLRFMVLTLCCLQPKQVSSRPPWEEWIPSSWRRWLMHWRLLSSRLLVKFWWLVILPSSRSLCLLFTIRICLIVLLLRSVLGVALGDGIALKVVAVETAARPGAAPLVNLRKKAEKLSWKNKAWEKLNQCSPWFSLCFSFFFYIYRLPIYQCLSTILESLSG